MGHKSLATTPKYTHAAPDLWPQYQLGDSITKKTPLQATSEGSRTPLGGVSFCPNANLDPPPSCVLLSAHKGAVAIGCACVMNDARKTQAQLIEELDGLHKQSSRGRASVRVGPGAGCRDRDEIERRFALGRGRDARGVDHALMPQRSKQAVAVELSIQDPDQLCQTFSSTVRYFFEMTSAE